MLRFHLYFTLIVLIIHLCFQFKIQERAETGIYGPIIAAYFEDNEDIIPGKYSKKLYFYMLIPGLNVLTLFIEFILVTADEEIVQTVANLIKEKKDGQR